MTQDGELFRAFAEIAAQDQDQEVRDSETVSETITYIAFLLERIASSTDNLSGQRLAGKQPSRPNPTTPARGASLAGRSKSSNPKRSPKQEPVEQKSSGDSTKTKVPKRPVTSTMPAFLAESGPVPSPLKPEHEDPKEGSQRKTKSQDQLEVIKKESAEQEQHGGLLGTLKKNLAHWDGKSANLNADNLQDAAGMAAGGPLYGAVKEIAALVESDEDDGSILGAIKKTFAEKTGVTRAKQWIGEKKDTVRNNITSWAGGDATVQAQVQSGQGGVQRGSQSRLMPGKGKKRLPPPLPSEEEKKQLELSEGLLAGQVKESKNEERRHEDLLKAIRQSSGGGLLDSLGDLRNLLRGRGGARPARGGRATVIKGGGKPSLLRRAETGFSNTSKRDGGTLLRRGKAVLSAEGGLLSAGATRAVTPTTRAAGSSAGVLAKTGGALGKAGTLGLKGLVGAARAIPIAGQALAAGMAILDGVQGWNDTEGQAEAFDVKEGQEATTGQKTSMAVANVLDMGGLLSGAGSLLGFDFNTADIAKTLYGAVDTAGTIASTIMSTGSGIADALSSGFTELLDSVGTTANTLWSSASETVTSTVAVVTSTAAGLLDSAAGTVASVMSTLKEKGVTLWNSATETLANAGASIATTASEVWDSASGSVTKATAVVAETTSSLFDSAKSFLGFGDDGKEGARVPADRVEQPTKQIPTTAVPVKNALTGTEKTNEGQVPQDALVIEKLSVPVSQNTVSATQPAISAPTPSGIEKHPTPEGTRPSAASAVPVVSSAALASVPNAGTAIAEAVSPLTSENASLPLLGRLTAPANRTFPGKGGEILAEVQNENALSVFETLTNSVDSLRKSFDRALSEQSGTESLLQPMQGALSGVGTWLQNTVTRARAGWSGGGGGSGSSGSGAGSGDVSTRASAISSEGLGALSAQYESGKNGSSAVGYDRVGGTSYGKYQIASNTGTMNEFLKFAKDKNPEVYERLKAAGPSNTKSKEGAFPSEWKKIVSEGKMGSLEHDFIKKTHFDPVFSRLKGENLQNMFSKSKAMQDVLWSTSVQHGGKGATLINRNYKEGMSEEDMIKALYADRGTQFGSSTAQIQQSALNRFASEEKLALSMVAQEKSSRGIASAPERTPESSKAINAAPVPTMEAQKSVAPTASEGQNVASTESQESVPAVSAPQQATTRFGETLATVFDAKKRELPALPFPVAAAAPLNRIKPLEEIRNPVASQMQPMNFESLENLMTTLIDVVRSQKETSTKNDRSEGLPHIRTEYDDDYSFLLAHDRA